MRKILFVILLFCGATLCCQAQEVLMRDLFAAMPDSLLPTMTKNNRLDCIDFIENNMEAKVRNKLDQFVELKKLTTDYLLLQTSEQSRVEMKCLTTEDAKGVVYLVRTYMGPAADSHIECYDSNWEKVQVNLERPSVEAFFKVPSEEHADTHRYIIKELKDLTLLEAKLAEGESTLTWTIALDELSVDDKKVAKQYVQSVVKALK